VVVLPTGYTSALYEGADSSFEDFAMNCARAFGVLHSLRDEPNSDIPLELKVDEYYHKSVDDVQARIDNFKSLSDSEIEEIIKENYFSEKRRLVEAISEKTAIEGRYRAMLDEVTAWTIPTDEHKGLRDFMIEQLESSIDADCNISYSSDSLKNLKMKTVVEYRGEAIREAERSLKLSQERLERAEKDIAEKNKWLSDLRESLKK
jgi:hypothetical protein